MADNINDNDADRAGRAAPEPDAHGQAAMLLVESLIHALIARSVISVEEAVELIDVAAEVDTEIGLARGESPATIGKSLSLLSSISASLKPDIQA